MLTPIAPQIWSAQHAFVVSGVPCSSRMTVVQLADGALWVHSPIPLSTALKSQLDSLGLVKHVVAPNLAHHLFVADFAAHYPQAQLWAAPGLAAKRPDLTGLQTLTLPAKAWAPELQGLLFEGMPQINETVWFHAPSATLILTDVCQHWAGPMPWVARVWATVSGVRSGLNVPWVVRLLTRNRAAAKASAQAVLSWPFERVVVAHNVVLAHDAHAQVARAFKCWA